MKNIAKDINSLSFLDPISSIYYTFHNNETIVEQQFT